MSDVLERFAEAWESWDLDAIMSCLASDAVFESTGPAPDGVRIEGAEAIRVHWQEMFDGTRDARFRFEESFTADDRAAARWRFSWRSDDGTEGHVRGVDVLAVRDGLVVEKLSYVKG